MKELEFRAKVRARVDEWFGGEDKYKFLYQWCDNDNVTAYVIAKTELAIATDWDTKKPCDWATRLHFLRLFEIGDKMQLSQDKTVEL